MASKLQRPDIAVIGVGASAGGVTALKELLPNLPKGSGFAYVVTLHLDPTHRSLLADILKKESALTVKTIVDGEKILPDTIYVTPSDHDCTVHGGNLRLHAMPEEIGPRHSIDIMLASLAESYGERGAGIVLSGTGSDGLHGMLAIKTAGGIVIAQDPETTQYPGMPRSVIDAGLADLVLPPARIGGELADIMRRPRKAVAPGAAARPEAGLDALLAVLSRKSRFDFSQYKESTLTRRVDRRMAVHKLDKIEDYVALVEKSDTEADLLLKDILISVTGFFRDEGTFKVVAEALKKIVEGKSRGEDIRIWVPGCATGEEAFSVAILLAEALGGRSLSTPVQIFASDVDAGAIAFARRGLYLESSTKTVPKRLLKKYFTGADGVYRVGKDIRDMVVFARHDLMRDAPYINLDLVSCRNVLIYFKRALQEKLIPIFHYSLNPGGYLVLGTSEGVGKFTDLFEPFAERAKVFVRIGEGRSLPAMLQAPHIPRRPAEVPGPRPKEATSLNDLYRDLVADAYAPPGVFVNGRFEVVHVQGDVTRFVQLPPGDLNVNVMDMAVPPLRLEARLVLQKAQRERTVVRGHPVELRDERGIGRITLIGIPAAAADEGAKHTLLLFEERRVAEPTEGAGRPEEDRVGFRIRELEQELVATREQLQTSNEELQSANEELRTVNDELTAKSEDLATANRDLENILNTVLSGIVVLDRDLRVTRYSIASKQVFDLWPTSIGRPLIAVGSPLDLTLLAGEIEKAMKSGTPVDRDLALGDRIFSVRLIPLHDGGNVPSGLVIAFSDETGRKRAEQETRRLAAVVRDSNDAIAVLDLDGRILAWNRGAEGMYGYSEAEACGLTIGDLVPKSHRAETTQWIERLTGGEPVACFETKRRTKDGREMDVSLTATLLRDENGNPQAVATTERDITESKRIALTLQTATERAEQANQIKSEFLAGMSHELRTPLNAIIGFSEIIENEMFGPIAERRYVEYGGHIHASGQHLLALVNDILDLSKIEAHEFQFEEDVLDLRELAEEQLRMLRLEADRRGVSLSIDAAADLPRLKSDRRAIRQILLNLLTNAVKFTPSGGRVTLEMRPDNDGGLRLAVRDTGIGIAEKNIPRILEPFGQVSDRLGTERAGTGLGLPIVRSLAAALGAEFNIASELGKGTSVAIRFNRERLVRYPAVRPGCPV